MKTRLVLRIAAVGLFISSAAFTADDATVTTYYPTPNTDYKSLYISDDLTVGNTMSLRGGAPDPLPADPYLPAGIWLHNNLVGGWLAGSSGGDLVVNGNFNVQNVGGVSQFYVDAATNRVGIGTTTPRTDLEVVGETKAMIIAGHVDTVDWTQPWADMFAEYNTSDTLDSVSTNGLGSRFAAVYTGFGYTFCTLHLDASPLVFQTLSKPGITTGQGKGQMVIRGIQINGDNDLILIVGEAVAAYGADLPVARANAWNPLVCSRFYKKDIEHFTNSDYSAVLGSLARSNIVSYLYKGESATNRRHTGFIAEEAPAEIVTSNRTAVSLSDEMGFLLASAKALRLETGSLKHRTEELRRWEDSR